MMKIKFITDGSYYGMESVIGKEYTINDDRVVFEDDTFLGVYGDFLNDITNDEALKDPSFNYLFIIGKEIEILDEEGKPEVETTESDPVNHPSHYNSGNIEVIEMVIEIARPYEGDVAVCIGNVVKYTARAPFKGRKTEDLRKAMWYLEKAIELEETKEAQRSTS